MRFLGSGVRSWDGADSRSRASGQPAGTGAAPRRPKSVPSPRRRVCLDIRRPPPYTRNRLSKTKIDNENSDRDLYSGLIRLHVLHHAVEEPIFGLGMIEELRRHGYRISPGSLYPLLHALEKKGYLRSKEERNGKSLRKVYRATPLGRAALEAAKYKVRELFHELIEGE